MKGGWKKGKYFPRHPEKYKGNINNIIFRSSWEEEFCAFCDNNPKIIEWASEPFPIPYIGPDGKKHKYYPDFWVKSKQRDRTIKQELIEIKPYKQISPPKTVGKRKKQQLIENNTYKVNVAKWRQAKIFCAKYGITFRILTERELHGVHNNVNRNKPRRSGTRPPTRRSVQPRRR